jgi:hypothetical protein
MLSSLYEIRAIILEQMEQAGLTDGTLSHYKTCFNEIITFSIDHG